MSKVSSSEDSAGICTHGLIANTFCSCWGRGAASASKGVTTSLVTKLRIIPPGAGWRPIFYSGPSRRPLFPDSEALHPKAAEEARHKSGFSWAWATSVCRRSTPHPAVCPSRSSGSLSWVGPGSVPLSPVPALQSTAEHIPFTPRHGPLPAQVGLFGG